MRSNAEDYLKEYAASATCMDWLRKVISVFLAGKQEEYLDPLARELIGISNCTIEKFTSKEPKLEEVEIIFKKLKHVSGVNALADNQEIRFCPNVNVIYGLNGTGKSSYFRIINEIIGAKRKMPILENIYNKAPESISVDLNYEINGEDKNISWDGSERGILDLSSVRVFDSGYTENMLRKREPDELVIKPYGLYMFAELDEFISAIAVKAGKIIEDKQAELPAVSLENVSEELRNMINKEEYTDSDVQSITDVITALDLDAINNELTIIMDDKMKLLMGNPADKLQLETRRQKTYEIIKSYIQNVDREIDTFIQRVKKYVGEYIEYKYKRGDFLRKIEILNEIPGTDTDEWKNFVISGKKYLDKVELNDKCPYCHRPYDDQTVEIIKAYMVFIGNDSEQKFQEKKRNLEQLRDSISQWNANVAIDNTLVEEAVLDLLKKRKESVSNFKEKLLEAIDHKTECSIFDEDSEKIQCEINKQLELIKTSISLLTADAKTKDDEIKKCDERLAVDNSLKILATQKKDILEMITQKNRLAEYSRKHAQATTCKRNMSRLSQTAHKDLLTSQLQETFSNVLQRMTQRRLEVILSGKISGGIQQTELSIKRKKNIDSILSEGEQKAAALALFLAEIKISNNKSTIVFDDPVNSLDHKIISAFTNEVMDLDNQLLIFTHSKLFLDCIETTKKGHVCSRLNSSCPKTRGKHIFLYETISEGQSRKGIVTEKGKNNSTYYLDKAETYLRTSPFSDNEATCSCIREAVENIIDEIIFNGQIPNKFSNKNGKIKWEDLKNLNPSSAVIDKLHTIHGRCSGGGLHSGTEHEENPLDVEELSSMCLELRTIKDRK